MVDKNSINNKNILKITPLNKLSKKLFLYAISISILLTIGIIIFIHNFVFKYIDISKEILSSKN